ncbi:MAG: L-ribulose-5-phosphate 3-epimerase [Verrucomicrobiales bacterium]|jgi:L-ribulose-5-phosphate 3-epimerase
MPKRTILKAVKFTMIRAGDTTLDKFKIAKDAGFDGMSLVGPDQQLLKESITASQKTDLPIHNVNSADHWNTRLSDPDKLVRRKALDYTKQAIRFAHEAGGSSILQVIGKVTDPAKENEDHVRERTQEMLSEAIPLAAELGIRICCENVKNGFASDAVEWAAYLDWFKSPWVAAFFDIGNHQRFGGAPHWIRTLGSERIVKLDVKDHDETAEKNCNLFDGDVDWPEVRKALDETGYSGWATAEVQGGDLKRLTEVVERMKRAIG